MSLAREYYYDAANRLSTWNYAANINNLDFPIQINTYSYDRNGNRTNKEKVLFNQGYTPQSTTYAYDFENRLSEWQFAAPADYINETENFTYNGEGLRTQTVLDNTTSNYLYDGSNILIEQDGSGKTTKAYTRGLDYGGGIGNLIDQTTTGTKAAVQYYNYNDLGSVSDLTTSAGVAASQYNYDAFGNLQTPQVYGDTNRYLFSTKEFDSTTGLDYFGAKYYDPEIGRWLTPDPLGFVNGMNVYAYVNNNPINLVDPYGLDDGIPGFSNEFENFGIPGYGDQTGGFNLPGFTTPPVQLNIPGSQSDSLPPTLNGYPDEFGPLTAPDLGGKENTNIGENSLGNNGDIFSNDGGGNTRTPIKGLPPNTVIVGSNGTGGVQYRITDENGNVYIDIDEGHPNESGTGSDWHIHRWDGTQRGKSTVPWNVS